MIKLSDKSQNINQETNISSPLGDKGSLQFLPISINVTNKKILLIGGGKVATHKGSIMARFVQNVTVISLEFTDEILKLPFTFIQKQYEKIDLHGFFLVYVCTGDHELNAKIKRDAEELGILTSVCDAPLLCDFVSPAIHKEKNVTIAVGSNAQDVYKSVEVRNRIRELVLSGTIQL
ncbi:MAG: bifunctional precorrin-2 dehydrogenase/sirohydrochlorin ferrochelatase [Paludibacter sp.]|nr:bifunctional precorrin-2 dehydrogenase/sirohydrochlorin ferrochelatase [Paludibacter sp.]